MPAPDFVKVPEPISIVDAMTVLPAPEIVKPIFEAWILLPNVMVPPATALNVVADPRVTKVSLSPRVVLPPITNVPAVVMDEGAVAVIPAVYVCVLPADPRINEPVLLNVMALVTVPPVPVNETLLTVFAIVKSAAVMPPVKLAVPPMFCKFRLPVPVNDVPVTSAPLTLDPVLKVRLYEDPVTAPKVISPALVLALEFRVVLAPSVTGPNVMAALAVLMVPFKVLEEGAVAAIPPV